MISRIFGLILFALLTITAPAHAVNETPFTDDAAIRKEANLPPEWFTCTTSDECGLVIYNHNGDGFAVNARHKDEAQIAFCEAMRDRLGYPICTGGVGGGPIPQKLWSMCEEGQCITKQKTQP